MFILYDLISLAISLFYLPAYLFKRKFHKGFLARLGFLPQNLKLDRPIWLHAVSVGEVMAAKGLVEGLRKAYPQKRLVISTVTATGNKIARGIVKDADWLTYLPLDLSFIVSSVINRVNPALFVIAETEIWPNLISILYRKNIPVITINGRISDRSLRGYLAVRLIVKNILSKITLFCVQAKIDADRLKLLGANESSIKVTGNLKFDRHCSNVANGDYLRIRSSLGLEPKHTLIVCGSTHSKEEEMILGAYKELLLGEPDLKLLIAPRDPQRCKDIAALLSRVGLRAVFISNPAVTCSHCVTKAVFLLDSIGELTSFYAAADIVFVGGSLVKKGGHNILEPACLSKPILFGPYMFNFRDIADLFLKYEVAIMVEDEEGLKLRIGGLLGNPKKAREMGERASWLISQNQGATEKTLRLIETVLEPRTK